MNNKKLNAGQVWKQLEDFLVPRFGLSVVDRAVYSHLLRHSRLEGKRRLRFSILWLARAVRLTGGPVREAVRRLIGQGASRLIEPSKAGHVVEVRLPDEIRAVRTEKIAAQGGVRANGGDGRAVDVEETDSLRTRALRQAIHSRERGVCFYCLRRITGRMQCLDHVVPRVQDGRNSYRDLVPAAWNATHTRKKSRPGIFCAGSIARAD